MSKLRRLLRRDEGSALMFIAIGLPVLFLIFAIVVDVGQWYVHKKALQNNVDSAAFAGSQLWGSCFKTVTTTPAWLPMQQEAQNYDGETGFAHNYNPQVGGTLKGAFGVNFDSTTFPNPLSQGSGPSPDDTPPDSCAPNAQGRYFFDVKATEQNVPLIFSGAGFGINGPTLYATARTELRQIKSLNGLLPIGVQDPQPEFMLAQFVNEDASPPSALTSWLPLCKAGDPGCPAAAVSGKQLWVTPTLADVTISTSNVGVRLKYVWAGSDSNPTCGTTVLVDCFDLGSSNGLVHIRGWNPSQSAPGVHDATLSTGTCSPDAYFAVLPAGSTACSAGITADVDLGHVPSGTTDDVWATVDGNNNAGQQTHLTLKSATGNVGTWAIDQGLTLSGAGPHTIQILWNCPSNSKGCSLGDVQRAFVADSTRSGPVQGIQIRSSSLSSGANSFAESGTAQQLGVNVYNPCFETELADPSCPVNLLRVSQKIIGGGGQSQSLDCDKDVPNIRTEIANGCNNAYTTFPQTAGETSCPSQTTLWASAEPWDCVAVQTGTFDGPIRQGFGDRIGTDPATCTNAWPDFPLTDKRQVPLFLVPYTAFNGTGSNQTFPVIGFGAFYVTGYENDPCPKATPNVPGGSIAGYFITYLPPGKGVKPSTKPCDPLGLTPCVPVLIK